MTGHKDFVESHKRTLDTVFVFAATAPDNPLPPSVLQGKLKFLLNLKTTSIFIIELNVNLSFNDIIKHKRWDTSIL